MDPQNKKYGVWEGLNYLEASEIKMIMILLNVVYCVADALRALGERERESLPQRKEEGGTKLCESTALFRKIPHYTKYSVQGLYSVLYSLVRRLACCIPRLLFMSLCVGEPVVCHRPGLPWLSARWPSESLHAMPLLVYGDGGSSSLHICRPTPC